MQFLNLVISFSFARSYADRANSSRTVKTGIWNEASSSSSFILLCNISLFKFHIHKTGCIKFTKKYNFKIKSDLQSKKFIIETSKINQQRIMIAHLIPSLD